MVVRLGLEPHLEVHDDSIKNLEQFFTVPPNLHGRHFPSRSGSITSWVLETPIKTVGIVSKREMVLCCDVVLGDGEIYKLFYV